MLRRNWNIFVAIGIAFLIVIGGALGNKWNDYHQQHASETQNPVKQTAPAIIVALPTFDQTEYSYWHQQECQDSDERSVRAAEDSAYWTMVTAIIGLIGTVVVAFSLIYSARAAEGAIDAVKEASRSADLAVEGIRQSKHSDRAWVLSILPFIDGGDPNVADRQTKIEFRWKNFGNSPAIKAQFWGRTTVTRRPESPVEIEFKSIGDFFSINLGPGDTHVLEGASIFGDDLKALIQGDATCFIFTKVEYFDIFEPTVLRVTEACYWVKHYADRPYAISFVPTQVLKNEIT